MLINSFQRYWWLKILQFDWTKDTTGHTHSKVTILDATIPWWLAPWKKKISSDSFCRILIIKESCNLVGQETQLAPPNLWISIFIKFKLTLNWYALPNIWLQCKDKLILIQSWKNTSYKGSIKKVLVLLTLKKFWNDML